MSRIEQWVYVQTGNLYEDTPITAAEVPRTKNKQTGLKTSQPGNISNKLIKVAPKTTMNTLKVNIYPTRLSNEDDERKLKISTIKTQYMLVGSDKQHDLNTGDFTIKPCSFLKY